MHACTYLKRTPLPARLLLLNTPVQTTRRTNNTCTRLLILSMSRRCHFASHQGLRELRAQEQKERQRGEKLAAKAAQKEAAVAAAASSGGAAAGAGAGAPSSSGGGEKKSRLRSIFSRGSSSSKAASGLGILGGGGRSGVTGNNGNANFPGSAVLPPPAGISGMDMSKAGRMDSCRQSFLDSSRAGGGGGAGVGFLDASIRGLDASVRGGQKGGPIAA